MENQLGDAVTSDNTDVPGSGQLNFEDCLRLLASKSQKISFRVASTIFRNTEHNSLLWAHVSDDNLLVLREEFAIEDVISEFRRISRKQNKGQNEAKKTAKDTIAILRYFNGSTYYLTESSLNDCLTNFVHSNDLAVREIQVYLGGQAPCCNVYRISVDRSHIGQNISIADVHSRFIQKDPDGNEMSPTTTSRPMRVSSTALVSALRISLEDVLHSLESHFPCRIELASADFIVDAKNRIHLEHLNSLSFVPSIEYNKKKEAYQETLQSNDRASWIGASAPDVVQYQKDVRARRKKLPPAIIAQSDSSSCVITELRSQVASAASNVELSMEEMRSSWKDLDPLTSLTYDINSESKSSQLSSKKQTKGFPTPFKCDGDYCDVIMDENELLNVSDRRPARRLKDIFSNDEWKRLENDLLFNSVTRTKLNPLQFGMIPKKSVILARDDRGVDSNLVNSSALVSGQAEGYMKSTQLASIRNDWSKVRGEMESGSAVYYDLVRVCGRCLQIYELLDKARIVLKENSLHTSSSENILHSQETLNHSVSEASIAAKKLIQTDSRRKKKLPKPHSWKERSTQEALPTTVTSSASFNHSLNDLDSYLRGKSRKLKSRGPSHEMGSGETKGDSRPSSTDSSLASSSDSEEELDDDVAVESSEVDLKFYYAPILLLTSREMLNQSILPILQENKYKASTTRESRTAIEQLRAQINGTSSISPYDALLIDGDDEFEVCEVAKEIRSTEKKSMPLGQRKRIPIICISQSTSLEFLKKYRGAGMDGCIGIPVTAKGVLSTLRAAIPHHLAQLSEKVSKVVKIGAMGLPQDSHSSEVMAAASISIGGASFSGKMAADNEIKHGIVQIDSQTRVPYTIMDYSGSRQIPKSAANCLYNVVVLNDLFDTCEKYRILLKSMANKYPGIQVLLWNYPGQAFTSWRGEQSLNNDYYSTCLNSVLGQVGLSGTGDFDTTRPYFLLGIGNGANIAIHFASHYRVPNLRGIISLNGFSFVDSFLAGAIHDCINVFSCSPSSRPDLPIYFYSRFLFSQKYLAKVSAPLALNIYTAVHNPITLQGRIDILKGTLNHTDLRPCLTSLDYPLISIHSTQDALVRPIHAEPLILLRKGEVRSIHQALKHPEKTCVIWVKSGHEAFQENRKQTVMLVEQILTGFHENNDISFPPASSIDPEAIQSGFFTDTEAKAAAQRQTFFEESQSSMEDKFLNGILKVVSNEVEVAKVKPGTPISTVSGIGDLNNTSESDRLKSSQQWEMFQKSTMEGLSKQSDDASRTQTSISSHSRMASASRSSEPFDPASSSFGNQRSFSRSNLGDNQTFPDPSDFPEVREYMNWRIKRNKKRLQRLERAAMSIQAAYRAHLATMLVKNARSIKAALILQRVYRGWKGKRQFKFYARLVHSARVLQRSWRGHLGRIWIRLVRHHIKAAITIERSFRSYLARTFVKRIRSSRHKGATDMQCLWRRCKAKNVAFRKRLERNSAITIQRVYRGHVGKKTCKVERDKYVFSRSQAHGIEFGRQMLLEHKLYATKLQSEISILSQEKVASESKVEEVLIEISEFDEEVKRLEKEMHQLSRVETESKGVLDVEGKFQLREQKLRLDKQFCEMLSRIKSRKESLKSHEKDLVRVDRLRQSKEEELRVLERKLVVLLEEQQRELEAIRKRQERRGEMLIRTQNAIASLPLAATSAALTTQSAPIASGQQLSVANQDQPIGYSGPSPYEKKVAAEMMQSAETLMKFGFMSMSMTYFSSLNMIKAMRTVAVQDTVMAAVSQSTNDRLSHSDMDQSQTMGNSRLKPALKPGQTSGQESLRVSAWSVEDVSKWLDALRLGQYREAFIDASVDGEFLYDLDDDDLRNTLSVEHRLHRKKILQCVQRLKIAESELDNRMKMSISDSMNDSAPQSRFSSTTEVRTLSSTAKSDMAPTAAQQTKSTTFESFEELANYSKHGKLKQLQKSLDNLPNKKYEKSITKVQYVANFGTAYQDDYERQSFHINKIDEHGNSLLIMAAQNGHDKIAKFLISKGSNPDHQNKSGQTAAHFAIAYNFLDLSTWLFEESGGSASDSIENKFGLVAYDGLGGEE